MKAPGRIRLPEKSPSRIWIFKFVDKRGSNITFTTASVVSPAYVGGTSHWSSTVEAVGKLVPFARRKITPQGRPISIARLRADEMYTFTARPASRTRRSSTGVMILSDATVKIAIMEMTISNSTSVTPLRKDEG